MDRLSICQHTCIAYGDDIRQDCEQSCGVVGGDRKVTLTEYLPPEKKRNAKPFYVQKICWNICKIVIYQKCISNFGLTF